MQYATVLPQLLPIPTFDIPPCADVDEAIFDDPDLTQLDASDRRGGSGTRTTGRRATANRSNRFEERPIELVLYVSSISPHSMTALRNIRRALAQFENQPFALTVHDLSTDPQRGAEDGVHFTPTLVSNGQGPRTWILGHLENPQVLREFLESALEQLEK